MLHWVHDDPVVGEFARLLVPDGARRADFFSPVLRGDTSAATLLPPQVRGAAREFCGKTHLAAACAALVVRWSARGDGRALSAISRPVSQIVRQDDMNCIVRAFREQNLHRGGARGDGKRCAARAQA